MFRCNPSPSEPQDHPQGVDHGIGIHPIKRYEGAHLFRPQDQNMHTLPLDIPLGYRDVSVFPSKIEGKLISVMGAFEVSRFPRGKDVESMVSAGQVHDHSLGCPVVGVKGLLVRVLLLVDGQVTSSHRERTQVEYPGGFLFPRGCSNKRVCTLPHVQSDISFPRAPPVPTSTRRNSKPPMIASLFFTRLRHGLPVPNARVVRRNSPLVLAWKKKRGYSVADPAFRGTRLLHLV
jgi:hypothetical protein